VIIAVSFRLWYSRGKVYSHSIEEAMWHLLITIRFIIIISHIIKINISNEIKEIVAPIDEMEFHMV